MPAHLDHKSHHHNRHRRRHRRRRRRYALSNTAFVINCLALAPFCQPASQRKRIPTMSCWGNGTAKASERRSTTTETEDDRNERTKKCTHRFCWSLSKCLCPSTHYFILPQRCRRSVGRIHTSATSTLPTQRRFPIRSLSSTSAPSPQPSHQPYPDFRADKNTSAASVVHCRCNVDVFLCTLRVDFSLSLCHLPHQHPHLKTEITERRRSFCPPPPIQPKQPEPRD